MGIRSRWWPVLAIVALLVPGVRPGASSAAAQGVATIAIEQPTEGARVRGPVEVVGWAADLAESAGTGIDEIVVTLDGPLNQGRRLGVARFGLSRPDLVAANSNPNLATAGFSFTADLAGVALGSHALYVNAHSPRGIWAYASVGVVVEAPSAAAPAPTPSTPPNPAGTLPTAGAAAPPPPPSAPNAQSAPATAPPAAAAAAPGPAPAPSTAPAPPAAGGATTAPPPGAPAPPGPSGAPSAPTTSVGAGPAGPAPAPAPVAPAEPGVCDPVVAVDAPQPNAAVGGVVTLIGWAADRGSLDGSGIARVEVYLDGGPGVGSPLVTASLGLTRPDVAANLGGQQFANAGWRATLDARTIPPGPHTVTVVALGCAAATTMLPLLIGAPPAGPAAIPAGGLPAPTDVTAAHVASKAVQLAWSPVPGVLGYTVYRYAVNLPPNPASPSSWELAGDTDRPGFRDSTGIAGVDYYYAIQAYSFGGVTSPLSTPVKVFVPY